jgi:DNA-binding CsgD family transcriptional regulator
VLRVALEPLTTEDVANQLETLAGAPVPAALAEELHTRAGGNPFFVEELFAARRDTLAEAVIARVERLDQAALDVLAAAGAHASYTLLERLDVAPAALRAALDAGVLIHTRDGLAFRHGLIGEVLYERLLPAERAALHRRIAAELHDSPAALRAHQYHRAGLREEALSASLQAGAEAAELYAYDAALAHFERALELGERTPDVLMRAAQAARFSGAGDRAVALCREALEKTTEPQARARLYERLGEFHFWDDEAALACYERGLELLFGDPRLLAAKGHALMGLRRWAESRACCEAALAAGAGPRITLGLVLAHLGAHDEGETYLVQALALAGNGEETARGYMHLGELRRLRGDHEGALAAMDDGERAAARLGLRRSFGHFMYVNGADDLLRLGRWDETAARCEQAARMALSRTATALRRAVAGQLHALRGDLAAARAELAAPVEADLPSEFIAPLAAARATLALTEGDLAAARAHVEAGLAATQDLLYTPPLFSLALRAEADNPDGLLKRFDALLEHPPPGALAHRALAGAEHDPSDPGAWRTAAEAFTQLGEPYPVAYARRREAEAELISGGPKANALVALREAHARATALGAQPLLADIEALARRARLQLEQEPHAAPEPNGTGLTARELEVLRLLADGLTNRVIAERLFVSQKTVAAHVAHIYDKLAVHSRVEAAGRAQRLGVLGK